MINEIKIDVRLIRLRWVKKDATGEQCSNCGCKTYLNKYEAEVLMKLGKENMIQDDLGVVLCQSCKP